MHEVILKYQFQGAMLLMNQFSGCYVTTLKNKKNKKK